MNTLELLRDLSKFACMKKCNFGVYASDELPKKNELVRPSLIIVNTKPSNHSGEHWCGFFFSSNSKKAEFFDSYGRKPMADFKRFIEENSVSYIYNTKKLQSNFSSVCGQYTLLFLYFRCKNRSLNSFLNEFDIHTPEANDKKILRMYAHLSRKIQTKSFKNQTGTGKCNIVTCNQTCVSLQQKKKRKINSVPRK